jgi:hypothetical protein
MRSIVADNSSNLAMTVYNSFTGQWRTEVRDAKTFICLKAILLPGSDATNDYRITGVKNMISDINWLVYS